MSSKLLKKGSEMHGKRLGEPDSGLKMNPNTQGVKIAPVSGPSGGVKKRGAK